MPRASRVPLVVGLLAVLPALGGLGWLGWAFAAGVENARVEPYLHRRVAADALVWGLPTASFAVLLLVVAVLLAAGRSGARLPLARLAAVGVTFLLWQSASYHGLMYPQGYDVWIGPARWIGATATGLALLGLLTTAVCLLLPVTRRALTRPGPPDGPVPSEAPGPLVRSPWVLGAGAIVGLGSLGSAIVLDGLATGSPPTVVIFGGFGLLMVGGGIWSGVAAGMARDGSRTAVRVARMGGGLLLGAQVFATCQVAETTMISLGRVPGAQPVPAGVGIALYVLSLFGVVATLVGLAGLSGAGTERFVEWSQARRDYGAPYVGWSAPVTANPAPAVGGWSAP